MTEYTLVMPTTKEKAPWLERTLFGFMAQDQPPSTILVGVDIKPWDMEPVIPAVTSNVRTVPFRPARAFKRQHEIINNLTRDLHGPVVILDDDYWLLTRSCMSDMLAALDEGAVVVPASVLHTDQGFPEITARIDGVAINYGIEVSGREVVVMDDGHGHNPFAGHPKLMMAEDFNRLGGFDWRTFTHYWWCDTDMWYRSRNVLKLVEANVPAIHVAHPKYKTELFQQQNSKAFLARHGANLMPVHQRMLDSVIK